MAKKNFIEKLSSAFKQSTTVNKVFNEPIHLGDKIIVPVAKLSYSLGGVLNQAGKKQQKEKMHNENGKAIKPVSFKGGGGMRAAAAGVYEITPSRTRFIPAHSYKHVFAGVLVGFLLKTFFFPGKHW